MILSNVNIGSGPSAGDGDPLRSAFNTINTNFQKITNNVNALSNSVTAVAGRTGNVVLTVNDIIGWSSIVTQANINTTVNAANIGMRGYVDTSIAANIAALINSAPGALDTLQELAAALGNNSSFASTITNSLATTNSNLIVANTNMRGYVDGQILAANSGVASAVTIATIANTNMRGYVDGQILAANSGVASAVTIANTGMKGYVDQANTIQSAQLVAANIGIIGYINQANLIQSNQLTQANLGIIGYVDQANTIQSAQIASANVGMKGYVDAVTAAWTANAQAQQNLLANIGALDLNNINATLGIHNGQINDLIANAGVQAGSIADLYANAAVQAALISSLGNTAQIQSNIAVLQSNAATQSDLIIRINSNVTQANLGMVGYVSSTVVTANVGMKGYVDSQIISVNTGANANITTANVGMKGYVDSINTILTANAVSQGANISLLLSSVGSLPGQIVSANLGMKGYVDSLTATYSNINVQSYLVTNSYATQNYVNQANTSLKNYVDGQIAAANTTAYSNVNVSNYLPSYGGNIAVNTIKFDDLSEQHTAYTGTQWRSNLASNVTVKPTWMSYYPGLKNQLGTQYGFDTGGMFFSGNADNDIGYPIRTNLHIHGEDTTEIIATINFANTNDDHGIAIFNSTAVPIWRYATDTTRIAFQFSSGTPRLYGQSTQDVSGTPVVTAGNDYTIKMVYNPGNTVTVYTYDGPDTTGALLDTRTINEVLPAGDYVIGFDADQDGIGAKSYFTNIIIRTLTNTVVNNLEVQGQVTGDLIPSANVTYSLGNITHQWKELWVSGNTIHIGGATLSVANGAVQSSLPIQANVTATNITVQGTRIEFASGGYIEESEVLDETLTPAGYYGIALNSSDDGVISMNALDSNSSVTSSVFVTNVSVQINVANSTPEGTALIWIYDQAGNLTLPAGGQILDSTGNLYAASSTYGNTIAIGQGAGGIAQGVNAVAIGYNAGNDTQGNSAVAIGIEAGISAQADFSVAVGEQAGWANQGTGAVAVGRTAGYDSQGIRAVAIGEYAGANNQGNYAVAIGSAAGGSDQPANSIIINAGIDSLNASVSGLYINPIRNATGNVGVLQYNNTTKEVSYSSNVTLGNVTAGNVFATTAYRFATGLVSITNDDSHVSLFPDTNANATAGVKVGGGGYILGPNSARNITLNYNGVSGAVGLQANVTIGTGGSGNLFVNGNIISRDITAGNIIATGTSGKIGYNQGGFAQQITSNATQVTSNFTSGNIQLMSIDLGVSAVHTVAFACNKLTTNDMLLIKHVSGGITNIYVDAYVASDGLAVIWMRNISGFDTGAFTPMLKYAIIRAPSS